MKAGPTYTIEHVGPSLEMQHLLMAIEEEADAPWAKLRLTAAELEAVDRMRVEMERAVIGAFLFGND